MSRCLYEEMQLHLKGLNPEIQFQLHSVTINPVVIKYVVAYIKSWALLNQKIQYPKLICKRNSQLYTISINLFINQ